MSILDQVFANDLVLIDDVVEIKLKKQLTDFELNNLNLIASKLPEDFLENEQLQKGLIKYSDLIEYVKVGGEEIDLISFIDKRTAIVTLNNLIYQQIKDLKKK